MTLSRRDLLLGSSSAFFALGGGLNVAFGDDKMAEMSVGRETPAAAASPVLVVVFCRFGQDGLQLLAPAGDPNYVAARPTIRITPQNGLPTGTLKGVDMYMHPSMPELKALYDAKQLAMVTAVGVPTRSRSHFDVQDMMERGGADGTPNASTGWLARYTATLGIRPTLGTIAVSANNPTSLLGDNQALAVSSPQRFTINGGTSTTNVSQSLVTGATPYEVKAKEMLGAITAVQSSLKNLEGTNQNNLGYTNGDLSTALRSLAQLIKMNVGVSVATIDMGGWDHHENLAASFQSRAQELSRAIGAFWKDIATYQNDVTLVTMTEFGRRFTENSNRGLDHGSASTMMVLNGAAKGGAIYGDWPGTAANQLFGGDLAVSTDYRVVLGEILLKRQGAASLANIFPNLSYNPLGLFA
jgi:uncharacterized protein (DUF1501 family)